MGILSVVVCLFVCLFLTELLFLVPQVMKNKELCFWGQAYRILFLSQSVYQGVLVLVILDQSVQLNYWGTFSEYISSGPYPNFDWIALKWKKYDFVVACGVHLGVFFFFNCKQWMLIIQLYYAEGRKYILKIIVTKIATVNGLTFFQKLCRYM